jgi:hypothetical protein
MLSVIYKRYMLSVVMLNVKMLSAVMLSVVMLSFVTLSVPTLSVIMLSVVMLSVIYKSFMLSVVILTVVMLSVITLNVFMLSVVMLNVIMLSVVAPEKNTDTWGDIHKTPYTNLTIIFKARLPFFRLPGLGFEHGIFCLFPFIFSRFTTELDWLPTPRCSLTAMAKLKK